MEESSTAPYPTWTYPQMPQIKWDFTYWIKCSHCGSVIHWNSRYCSACGKEIYPMDRPKDKLDVIIEKLDEMLKLLKKE